MSVIEFKNAKGQLRYQPALPDGRRLYGRYWNLPDGHPKGEGTKKAPGLPTAPPWAEPTLYRSRSRASRRASRRIAEEFIAARERFQEAK